MARDAEEMDAAQREYIRDAAATPPTSADEIERLAALRSQGVIDDDEFTRMKEKVVAGS